MDNTTIEDCQINIYNEIDCYNDQNIGGIAGTLKNNSHIRRCYVDGKPMQLGKCDYVWFSGIVYNAHTDSKSASIEHCAIGKIDTENTVKENRIFMFGDINLTHNISIDSNDWGREKKANGASGESVSKDLFKQYYFENILGWDFENVWQWNIQENRPELIPQIFQVIQYDQSDILLIKQIQDNIWL